MTFHSIHAADPIGMLNPNCRDCQPIIRNNTEVIMRAMSNRRRQSTAAMRKVRAALEERCQGRCEKCALPLGRSDYGYVLAAHHRLRRSAGGSDSITNLLALHPMCHNQHRNSVHDNVEHSMLNGWIVRRGDRPENAPLIYMGRKAFLRDDGSVFYLDEEPF